MSWSIEKLKLSRRLNCTRAGRIAFVCVAVFFGLGCRSADLAAQEKRQAQGKAATNQVRLLDLTGQAVDPFQTIGAKAFVFIFISNDCPISNRYAPEVRRLYEKFAPNKVVFRLVHPNSDESAEAIQKHMKDFQYPCEALRDPKHELVRKAKVRVTPEAAVFSPGGDLLYHGRIDDRYVDFGKERPAATKHDLEEAVQAILDGKPVRQPVTKAIGCYISDL